MSTPQTQPDDLTAIKGIGRSRQKWFHDVFAVQTYGQLAALSAAEVEEALKAAGKLASRAEIERWLVRARELAAASPAAGGDAEATPGEERAAARTTRADESWTPVASFVVEFQRPASAPTGPARRTAIHYLEADQGEVWPGVAFDQVHNWLVERVPIPEPEIEEEVAVEALAAGAALPVEPATLRATQVRILQMPLRLATIDLADLAAGIAAPLPTTIRHASHEKPITIELDVAVSGAARAETSAQRRYTARCQVHNLTSGQQPAWVSMENAEGSAVEKPPGYESQRAELQLEPGVYELGVLLSGRQVTGPTYLELPKLNVL
jgi:hypothetical protein